MKIICKSAVMGINVTETDDAAPCMGADRTSYNRADGLPGMESFLYHCIHKFKGIQILPVAKCNYVAPGMTAVFTGIFDKVSKSLFTASHSFDD